MLMMGGKGTRFNADIPKQFVEIQDRPLFTYILKGFEKADIIDRVIVVSNGDWIEAVERWCTVFDLNKVVSVVPGGATRSESVRNGLEKAREFARDDDILMIHDATHPYVDEEGMAEMVEAVKQYGGATLGQRQYDTCYEIDENDMLKAVFPRECIVSGASPEAFLFGKIYDIYENATDEDMNTMTSAGAIALKYGISMKVCTLHSLNLKVTYPEDMKLLKVTMGSYFFAE